jgi:hypothetical protein
MKTHTKSIRISLYLSETYNMLNYHLPSFVRNAGIIALRHVTPLKRNTGMRPIFSAIDEVNIFTKLPVD